MQSLFHCSNLQLRYAIIIPLLSAENATAIPRTPSPPLRRPIAAPQKRQLKESCKFG